MSFLELRWRLSPAMLQTICADGSAQYNPEYLAVNPRHTVPCLEVRSAPSSRDDDDAGGGGPPPAAAAAFRVTEAHSVLRFLCGEVAGLEPWYPANPRCASL